jgi:serine/threonine-protein kinase RsbW
MAEANVHTLLISTPPDDVDDVHALLESVWRDSAHVLELDRISFETALIELASNVIRHADSGHGVTATLTIEVSGDQIKANLKDSGKPGNIELGNRSMPTDLSESGRGIALIQALVDELNYERDANHNHWQIIRKLKQ